METPVLRATGLNLQGILDSGKYQSKYKTFEHGASGDYTNYQGNAKYVPHKWHEVLDVDTSSEKCSHGLNLFHTPKDCLEFINHEYTDDTEFWEFVVPIDDNITSNPSDSGKYRVKFANMHRKLSDGEIFTHENLSENDISNLCKHSPKFMELIRDGIINIDLTNHQKCLLLTYQDYYDESLDVTCLSEDEIDYLCVSSPKFMELIRDDIININLTDKQKCLLLIHHSYYDESLDVTCLSEDEIFELCRHSPKFMELIRDGIINIDLTNKQKCLLLTYQDYYDESLDFTCLSEDEEDEIVELCKCSPKFMELIREGVINIDLTNKQKRLLLEYQGYYDRSLDVTCLSEDGIDWLCECSPKFMELIRDGIININLTNNQKHLLLRFHNYYDGSLDFTRLSKYEINDLCSHSPKFMELIRDGIIVINLTNKHKCLLLEYQGYYDKSLDFTCLSKYEIDCLCKCSPKFMELIRDGIIVINLTNKHKCLLLEYQGYYDKSLDFTCLVEYEIIELCECSPKFMELIREGVIKSPIANALRVLNGVTKFEDVDWKNVDESYIIKNYLHVHN